MVSMLTEILDEEGKAHAKYSASGSERWLHCPGSIRLSEKAPPQPESKWAKEGTEAHSCLEFLLKNRHNLASAYRMAAAKYPADMLDHCQFAFDWIINQLNSSPGAELLCETQVDSSSFTCANQFGTLDAAIVREFGKLTVIDFKYGAGVVVNPEGYDGRGNSQLCYYALATSKLYHHNFSEVELVVIQPRGQHHSGEVVRSFTMPIKDLLAWGPEFSYGVMRCETNDGALKSGEWCRFCPAAILCPELKQKSLERAQVVFSDTKGLQSLPEPKLIQIPNLGTILTACDRLEDWIKKVRDHAEHVLERGEKVVGWKLVEKRSVRHWIDEGKTGEEAKRIYGSKAFTTPELLSPAQLEKLAGKDKVLSAKIKAFVAERVSNKSSGTTLVDDSDSRPGVNRIESAFGGENELGRSDEEYSTAIPDPFKKVVKKKSAGVKNLRRGKN